VIVPVLLAVIALTALGREARGIAFGGGIEPEAMRAGRFARETSPQESARDADRVAPPEPEPRRRR
jgi:hypothetical protein